MLTSGSSPALCSAGLNSSFSALRNCRALSINMQTPNSSHVPIFGEMAPNFARAAIRFLEQNKEVRIKNKEEI
jgi:hypothetical protein